MVSDLFHVYPTDGKVNGMRSNYPFGEVGTPSSTSTNGSKVGTCSYPGYSGTVFEPIDEFKGDFARTYFYMATRYETLIDGWSANSTTADAILNETEDQVFEDWYLNMIIEWHNADPVSQKEIDRNDAVYAIQNNRNPFIDHPEYVAQIWGGDGVFISSVNYSPTSPTSSNDVTVIATITSSSGSITTANLKWGTSTGNYPNTVAMTASKGSYSADIPAQANGTNVYFIIEAEDDNAESSASSEYSYTINDNPAAVLLDEDFTTCPSSGWISYSGASNKDWTCGSGYESINAFSGDAASDDWLITPPQDLDSYDHEVLTFTTWTQYFDTNYPSVELKYSTNYSGSGNPSAASWTNLTATWAAENSQVSTSSGDIDLSGISGTSVYFAFHYTSTGTTSGSAALWRVDDVVLTGETITNALPQISNITNTPESPTDEESVTVSATITDDGTVTLAEIKWGTESGSYPNSVTMTNSGDVYSGEIPSQIGGTTVYYVLEATDNDAGTNRSDENSYTIALNELPQISNVSNLPLAPTEGEDVVISATVADSDGTISLVEIKWGTAKGDFDNTVTMTYSGSDNIYNGTISSQAGGTIISYVIEATDNDADSNRSDEYSFSFNTAGNEAPEITNVEYDPTNPESEDVVTVSAIITDTDGSISSASVKWGLVSGSYPNIVSMTNSGDDYSAEIPAQTNETQVYFIVYALDEDAGSAQSEEMNYLVEDINLLPEVTNVVFDPENPESSDNVRVSATINDSDGTISTASVKWGLVSASYPNIVPMSNSGDTYTAEIPAQTNDTHVYFIVYALDEDEGSTQSEEFDYLVEDVNQTPEISNIVFDPTSPESTESVDVTATIVDLDGTIAFAKITWGTISGTYSDTVSMSHTEDTYSGTIPAQADNLHIYFKISVEDNEGAFSLSTEYSYVVDDPNILPEIANVVFDPENPESSDNVRVLATITDTDGTISSTTLKWGTSTGTYPNEINMTVSSADTYISDSNIPAQQDGTTVYVVIEAEDNEAGIKTSTEFNYAVTDPVNQEPVISDVSLNPASPTENDNVSISATATDSDGSVETVILKWKRGAVGTYTEANMNLSGGKYYGLIPKQSTGETIYFSIIAEDNEGLQGTYNDEYEVSESNGIDNFENSFQIFPNPASGFVSIKIENFHGKIEIKMYDILGVQVLIKKIDFSSQYNLSLEDLDSGIYFINLEADNVLVTKRIIIKK